MRKRLNHEVKIDFWGKDNQKDYVTIGLRLNERGIVKPTLFYTSTIALFIEATFGYVSSATRVVGF